MLKVSGLVELLGVVSGMDRGEEGLGDRAKFPDSIP